VRIAAVVQGFAYGRGRATTMVELLAPLAAAGHTVDVFVTAVLAQPVVEGVTVRRFRDLDPRTRYDVTIYNSGLPGNALDTVKRLPGRKLMCQHSYQTDDPGLRFAHKVWFPSNAARRAHTMSLQGTWMFVVPPPIDPERYRTTPGTHVSLSLSSPWKGGQLVARMARAMPAYPFLVVKDGRGNGVELFRGLRNVELVDFLQPRDFYGRTRVQLFPSRSETYGRVGVEGAVSGIPLVASKDPGIREAMGGHGIFLDRENTIGWVRAVSRLMDDQAAWERASRDVLTRGKAVTYRADQAAFVHEVETLGRER
jgi:glycosyltransferase involved in cell wall biosynthesis